MPRLVRATLVSLLVLALDLALPGPASAAPILDQEQPTIDTSPGFVFGIGGASEQKLAQVVTAGLTGNLTEVDLSLGCVDAAGTSGGGGRNAAAADGGGGGDDDDAIAAMTSPMISAAPSPDATATPIPNRCRRADG